MSRYTAHVETEVSGDTFVRDNETGTQAWFGDTPIYVIVDIVEKMNTEDGYADKYAWVDADFNLVKGP